MSSWWIYGIGFLAQLLFSSRLFVQWILSEKKKRVVTPSLFWKMSLLAAILLFVYGYLRDDLAIMLGQTLTYFIYIRNLHLQGEWQKTSPVLRWLILTLPFALVLYGWNNGRYDLHHLLHNKAIPLWLMSLGILSQVLFTFRFVYQWIYSEKINASELPVGFWQISVAGAVLTITYAILRKDPVLFIGHATGLIIYVRNIMIWKRQIHEMA